jgi:hypothetical protein
MPEIPFGRVVLAILLIFATASEIVKIATPAPVSSKNAIESLGQITRRSSEVMLTLNSEIDWVAGDDFDFNREMTAMKARAQAVTASLQIMRAAIDDYADAAKTDRSISDALQAANQLKSASVRVYTSQVMRIATSRNKIVASSRVNAAGLNQNRLHYQRASADLRASLILASEAKVELSDWVSKRIP